MSRFDVYIFIVCLIVFIMLAGASTVLISIIFRQAIKLVRGGVEDDKIRTGYYTKTGKKKSCCCGKADCVLSVICCVFLFAFFAFSLYMNLNDKAVSDTVPTFKVVKSESMSKKHKDNKYLVENNLNDQFHMFDLISTYKLPKEEDLQLYDIVVYEVDDMILVHRIVKIEDPNNEHPTERWFLLQGDAVGNPDRFPVKYEQMKAIYRGEKVPFLGSFVAFMQSPAGWMCIMLVLVGMIATPIMDKTLEKEVRKRAQCMDDESQTNYSFGKDIPVAEAIPLEKYKRSDAAYVVHVNVSYRSSSKKGG